jgi:tetratricopeptide (TPR) repeat protein
MKKLNCFIVQFLMMCWVVFIFASVLNAAEISADARKHMLRGEAAMETAKAALDAKNTRDFQSAVEDAVKEFKMATKYAPDWADAWFNLGVAQESAGDYTGAIASFNKYLNLNPQASDRTAIEDRIIKLEYKQERAQKQRQEKQQSAAKTRKIQQLAGAWREDGEGGTAYEVTVTGNAIEITAIGAYLGDQLVGVCGASSFRGTIQGLTIQGTGSNDWSCAFNNGKTFTRPMTGTISAEGNTIQLKYTRVIPAGGDNEVAYGWRDKEEKRLIRKIK